MNTCRQRVLLLLACVLGSWPCSGETQGVGGRRFDVRGTVFDSGDRPVGEALVVLISRGGDPVDWDRPEDNPRAFVTHADMRGMFVLPEVPGDSYSLYARSGDGQAHVRLIGFHDAAPPPYDIRLSMTEVQGTVFWPDGRTPLADAIVGLDYDHFVTRTDEDGKFSFAGIEPKEYAVFARVQLQLPAREIAAREEFAKIARRGPFQAISPDVEEIVVESKVAVELDGAAQLTMLLHGGIVQGVVRTEAGRPVVGVRVAGGGRRARMTDHAGRFEFTYVPVGPFPLYVQGRNNEVRITSVDVAPGGDPTRVEITLYPFRPQVTYRFRTPDGEVLANESVRFVARGLAKTRRSAAGVVKTDDHGRWREQWMDSGSRQYMFLSTNIGYAEQIVIVAEGVPEVHHEITLAPGGSICGIVRDQLTGAPHGGANLSLIHIGADGMGDPDRLWNRFRLRQASRDGDGTFCFRNLPPGSYGLYLGGAGFVKELTLEDAEDFSDVEIMVATALAQRWIVGRVIGPDNSPLVNTEVRFVMGRPSAIPSRRGGVSRRSVTDDLGLFRVGPLDPREYWLRAVIPGHWSKSTRADVTAESVDVGDLQLVPIEGR